MGLVDRDGVYGGVRFLRSCEAAGIKGIIGSEITVTSDTVPPGTLVLIAQDAGGYEHLCNLLTRAHFRSRDTPSVTLDELAARQQGLHVLTATDQGALWRLVADGRLEAARRWLGLLQDTFGDNLSVELAHHVRPGDTRCLHRLVCLAAEVGVPTLATGDVRYAVADDYRRYDLLTCVRLGISVFEPHPERPTNSEAHLCPEKVLRRRIPYPEAFDRAVAVAHRCNLKLLPGRVMPPRAHVPQGLSARAYLQRLCLDGVEARYAPAMRQQALATLKKELRVIFRLDLEEYFLVVYEVVREARRRNIRCAGRGSAANSIVAYLLGITGVCPVAHNLLFERFLHTGRTGTPDIDVDFDAERRDEIIAWMEARFGTLHTAMTATLQTYRLRAALRDAAKALGWDASTTNLLTAAVPHRRACEAPAYEAAVLGVLGTSPLARKVVEVATWLEGCPRHLGLHAGGMVLARETLGHYTPVQVSANGVSMVQFDKDDVERLGLIKLDVLGLRMLAAISEAEALVKRFETPDLDLERLPLDDSRTFNLIRAGRTLGTFQIESQGQLHLLGVNQPESFDDLIVEIALFRPGPLQGGMVHPYVRRRQGRETVTYEHPSLKPILQNTLGLILFQEQVLEVAHQFAGMSLEEADAFRQYMSKYRIKSEMETMRDTFVSGAVAKGADVDTARRVFKGVSSFVGYGFCRSHAAAFAKTVYLSCYLKAHHPAAFMAAVMQQRPGMYPLMTLENEARRCGVPVLLPDLNKSGIRYDLERDARGKLAVRKPLTSVKQVTEKLARQIVWARLDGDFSSIEDFYRRVRPEKEVAACLARSGALDSLCAGDSRRALWEVGVLARRIGSTAPDMAQAELFAAPLLLADDVPDLEVLTVAERLSWDLQLHGGARAHPMTLLRHGLASLEVRTIETCFRIKGNRPIRLAVAGTVMLRQKPPTAKGFMFVTLEDETGHLQCVVPPHVQNLYGPALASGALIVRGRVEAAGNWRGLLVEGAWRLDRVFGGYKGYASASGGRDRLVVHPSHP